MIADPWGVLRNLYTVDGPAGVARLEEADDDTHRATWRYGGTTVTATLDTAGRLQVDAPELGGPLAAAIRPGRLVAASGWRP